MTTAQNGSHNTNEMHRHQPASQPNCGCGDAGRRKSTAGRLNCKGGGSSPNSPLRLPQPLQPRPRRGHCFDGPCEHRMDFGVSVEWRRGTGCCWGVGGGGDGGARAADRRSCCGESVKSRTRRERCTCRKRHQTVGGNITSADYQFNSDFIKAQEK